MADNNGSSHRYRHAEQENIARDIQGVLAGSHCFSTKVSNIESEYKLAGLVGNRFKSGRNADFENLQHILFGQAGVIGPFDLYVHNPVEQQEE
ncbi:hypothetical protein D3C80_1451700 [compost metagenome]